MVAAVLRVRTCAIVLVLFLTTISVACAANQTITLETRRSDGTCA